VLVVRAEGRRGPRAGKREDLINEIGRQRQIRAPDREHAKRITRKEMARKRDKATKGARKCANERLSEVSAQERGGRRVTEV
jgi:hypothetical protein